MARLDEVQVYQRALDDARARLEVAAVVTAARAGHARVTVGLPGGPALGAVDKVLARGRNEVRLEVVIDKPERWWPNGLGAQKLYTLETSLAVDGVTRGRRQTRIGLRTLEVVNRHDAGGKTFTVVVNGAPVFMKGANWIPADSFVTRVTEEKYRSLLQSAASANMNMIRVWGGGIYEDDRFYALCDELGLLVWQDFMFACSMYPGDAPFIENVRLEATENVRRLRNHPSLALWAGNNEIEAAWQQWGWPAKFHLDKAAQTTIWNDYKRVFHEVLPRVVAAEDPGRFYTRSTPSANEDGVAPGKMGWGDMHYWGVWHAEAPYEAYAANVSRFMSEYGFQSFPTLPSVARYAPPSEWRIDSPVMLSHQRHPRGNALVRTYMDRDFRAPKDFGAFLYLSQVLQANVIQFGAEAHRRRMPYNMGSLYWQLDDCWPVASWSSIDYYGTLEGAAVRRAALLRAGAGVARRRERDVARLPGVGSAHRSARAPDLASGRSRRGRRALALRARRHRQGADQRTAVLGRQARHPQGGRPEPRRAGRRADRRRCDGQPQPVLLPEDARPGAAAPELALAVTPHRIGATVKVTARRFARAVWLSTPDGDGAFSDNFFDLLPGETATVEWTPAPGARPGGAERLSSVLHATTVRDTY